MQQFDALRNSMLLENGLAAEFFAAFARWEFALKDSGYFVPNREDAVADWDRLANELGIHFLPNRTKEVADAVEFLMKVPPNKQVIEDGRINLVPRPRPATEPQLLSLIHYVRRMRNNLFHGGKDFSTLAFVERDKTLLKHGLIILAECLVLAEEHSRALYDSFFEN